MINGQKIVLAKLFDRVIPVPRFLTASVFVQFPLPRPPLLIQPRDSRASPYACVVLTTLLVLGQKIGLAKIFVREICVAHFGGVGWLPRSRGARAPGLGAARHRIS